MSEHEIENTLDGEEVAVKESLKVKNLREELEDVEFDGPSFVLYAAQQAPFSLVGLVADGNNYLTQSIPVQPGARWIIVPLNPPPSDESEIWWAALTGVAIQGMAAILVMNGVKRLLGRKTSVGKGEVWSGSSIV